MAYRGGLQSDEEEIGYRELKGEMKVCEMRK
jgi:hypothetical protein